MKKVNLVELEKKGAIRKEGFTILEVLISLSILVLTLMVLFQSFSTSIFILSSTNNLWKAISFAQNELLPEVLKRDEEKIWPKDAVKKMADLGFMGIMVDQKYGGGGMDTISYTIAMEEIAKVDAAASVIMSVNNSLVCSLLSKFGNEFQKDKYSFRLCL